MEDIPFGLFIAECQRKKEMRKRQASHIGSRISVKITSPRTIAKASAFAEASLALDPCREDRIRTCDPYVPNVVRYRAALLPDSVAGRGAPVKRVAKIRRFADPAK